MTKGPLKLIVYRYRNSAGSLYLLTFIFLNSLEEKRNSVTIKNPTEVISALVEVIILF